jgi:hypothetical protein
MWAYSCDWTASAAILPSQAQEVQADAYEKMFNEVLSGEHAVFPGPDAAQGLIAAPGGSQGINGIEGLGT